MDIPRNHGRHLAGGGGSSEDLFDEVSLGGQYWRQWTTEEITNVSCVPALSFTPINFKNATMIQSNLGGQGGRCVDTYYTECPISQPQCSTQGVSVPWSDLCEEAQPGTPPNPVGSRPDTPAQMDGNMAVFIRDIGKYTTEQGVDHDISLRITNMSEYRAWNPRHNGVKRQGIGDETGFFGAINLLGPRSALQRPYDKFWTDQFTMVQLKFSFVTSAGASLSPLTIGRTFITFCTRQSASRPTESIPNLEP